MSSIALKESSLKRAEQVRVVYSASIPKDVEYVDLFKPEYWAHVAKSLRPFYRIEIIPEDFSYHAELIVVASNNVAAKVHEISFTPLSKGLIQARQSQEVVSSPKAVNEPEEETEPTGESKVDDETDISDNKKDYKIKWRAARKWSVVKVSSGDVIAEDITDKVDAEKYLETYLREMTQ